MNKVIEISIISDNEPMIKKFYVDLDTVESIKVVYKKWNNDMTKVEELEKAVDELSEKEYSLFRQRFFERDWKKWGM